jgi:hypothetical protein
VRIKEKSREIQLLGQENLGELSSYLKWLETNIKFDPPLG